MATLDVADDFSGTDGAQVDSRPPTTSDKGSVWAVNTPSGWVLDATNKTLNTAASNYARIATDIIPSADVGGAVVSQCAIGVVLDAVGSTPVGGGYGGIAVALNGFDSMSVRIIFESGVYKVACSVGSSAFSTSLGAVGPDEYALDLTYNAGLIKAYLDGVEVGSGTTSDTPLVGGSGTIGDLVLTSTGSKWKDFYLTATYEEGVVPPEPTQFWTAFRDAREVI